MREISKPQHQNITLSKYDRTVRDRTVRHRIVRDRIYKMGSNREDWGIAKHAKQTQNSKCKNLWCRACIDDNAKDFIFDSLNRSLLVKKGEFGTWFTRRGVLEEDGELIVAIPIFLGILGTRFRWMTILLCMTCSLMHAETSKESGLFWKSEFFNEIGGKR